MTTSDSEWQRVLQRVTTSDHFGWCFFFQIRQEPTIRHPKESSLNLEEDLWRGPIKWRAEASPLEEIVTVRSGMAQVIVPRFSSIYVFWNICNIHRKTPVLESLFNKAAGQAWNFIKKRLQNKAFSFRFCETFKKVFFTEHGRLLLIIAYINEIWPTLFHKVTTKFGKVDQQFYQSNLIKLNLSCTCDVKYSKLSLNTVNYRSDI